MDFPSGTESGNWISPQQCTTSGCVRAKLLRPHFNEEGVLRGQDISRGLPLRDETALETPNWFALLELVLFRYARWTIEHFRNPH
jgi:hypothetical protein